MNLPYSMVIHWSDADGVYIAHLVEFGDGAKTHGDTYDEAAKNGREVLEMLVEDYIRSGQALPKPDKYPDVAPSSDGPRRASRSKAQLLKQG